MDFLSTPYLLGYEDAIAKMEILAREVSAHKRNDTVWFLEHPPIYTIGRMGQEKDVKSKLNYPLISSSRGGKITYHGPGQLIIYFICNLKHWDDDVNKFVSFIEETGIKVLKHFGINAQREKSPGERLPGLWVNGKKIASLGLLVEKGITTHGMSFNVCADLKNFDAINVCGIEEKGCVTSLEALGIKTNREIVENLFKEQMKAAMQKYAVC